MIDRLSGGDEVFVWKLDRLRLSTPQVCPLVSLPHQWSKRPLRHSDRLGFRQRVPNGRFRPIQHTNWSCSSRPFRRSAMPFSAITKLRESETPEVPGSVGTKPRTRPGHTPPNSRTLSLRHPRTHELTNSPTTRVCYYGSDGVGQQRAASRRRPPTSKRISIQSTRAPEQAGQSLNSRPRILGVRAASRAP